MMKHYVLCLLDTDEAAQEITQRVSNAGFAKEEIFVLSSDRKNSENSADRREEEPGLFHEGVGLLAASGATMVGGTGNLMGASKMMDAAGCDEPGVGEGNAIAFLGALGLSETAEAEYLKRLADGGTLVAVEIDDQKMAAIARKIFEEAHAQEISEV
jgi:predicted O-methyltransferase YrrM